MRGVTRTAADTDVESPGAPNVSRASPTTRANIKPLDRFESQETRKAGIPEPANFPQFPEMELLAQPEKSQLKHAASLFAELYENYSDVESVRAGINLATKSMGSGPLTKTVNQVSKVSPTISNALKGVLASSNIALSAAGAAASVKEASFRYSQVLKKRQDLLNRLQNESTETTQRSYSDGELDKEIQNPEISHLTTNQMLIDVMKFAESKEQRRVGRAAAQALGDTISTAGGVMAIAGAAGAGAAAIPGVIVGAIGSGISLAVSAGRAYNGVIKKIMGTKGTDRQSAANFIWGLALRHNKATFPKDSESSAAEALRLANAWAAKTPENSMERIQQHAHNYLETMGLIGEQDLYENQPGSQVSLTSEVCGQAIFRNLGSVPSS